MASSSSSPPGPASRPPPPPYAPQNPGPSPAGSLPVAFSNMQISRAAPPFAGSPGGPPPANGPSIRAPPLGARPIQGSPPPLFAGRPVAPSQQQQPPFGGLPPAALALQPQRPASGPPQALVQRPPLGGPPSVVPPPQQPLPFGGPPGAVSHPAPFSGPPAAPASQPTPFGGPLSRRSPPPAAAGPTQAASTGGMLYSAAQPPPFSGLSGAIPQAAPSGGLRPPFGGPPGKSQQVQFGVPPQFGAPRPGTQAPLFGPLAGTVSQTPPLMGPLGSNAPTIAPPGSQGQARPGSVPGIMQPSMRMPGSMLPSALGQGMAPGSTPTMPYSPHAQVSTPSKIDPNQIPRPIAERSVIIFETRQGGQAAIPPAASSEFIVKDTGNCNPRLMRCTINQIPCTGDLLKTSGMPLALLVQPFALPHPSEEPIEAAFLALKSSGGKLLVFQSVLPSIGIGSLSAREAEGRSNVSTGDKEAHKLLQPADKNLKTMALEFAEYQVCVDVFLMTQSYVDISSISVVPNTTGGRVYYYYPFSALSDPAKLFNDLRWNISRPQGFEAVMRVRCSQGLQVQEYFGSVCKRVLTDVDLPVIDSDKAIMVTFNHNDKFHENSECAFQCALLYTTVFGQRRIRVMNLSLSCTNMLSNLFRYADLETQFTYFVKQAANAIPSTSLSQVRDQVTSTCINILQSYRKYCASACSSGQLILPEALKLLPLYTLALTKSIGLRNDGRLDDRSYWVSIVSSISVMLAVPLVFPRMIALHNLTSREDDSLVPSPLTLNSENICDYGVYLLENGEDGFIYVGNSVNPAILEQLFGVSSLAGVPNKSVLEQFDNELSRKVNEVVNEIRRQRCSYMRFTLCKKGDPSGVFFRSLLVEDKAPGSLSYVEFLVHVHRQIQNKMT